MKGDKWTGKDILFSLLGHSSKLIFLVKDNTYGVLLYQREAYFGIRKISFLSVMKITMFKMYKNKHLFKADVISISLNLLF